MTKGRLKVSQPPAIPEEAPESGDPAAPDKGELAKVPIGNLTVGMPLPFAVRTQSGLVLLPAGTMISTPGQLKLLERLDLRCDAEEARQVPPLAPPVSMPESSIESPIGLVNQSLVDLEAAMFATIAGIPGAFARLRDVATAIERVWQDAGDAAIAALHVPNVFKATYSIYRAYQTGILAAMILDRFPDIEGQRRVALIVAALCANIGMLELQNALYFRDQQLTDRQREQINVHPLRSARILAEAGVDDEELIEAVTDHHERVDGGGYPAGIEGAQVGMWAQVIGLADRYGALVAGRSYRPGMNPKAALQSLYDRTQVEFARDLVVALIKVMGVYPPGTVVRLASGECGVVACRQDDGAAPLVKSVISARGTRYPSLICRDTRMTEHRIVAICDLEVLARYDPYEIWG